MVSARQLAVVRCEDRTADFPRALADTNILIYAFSEDGAKAAAAEAIHVKAMELARGHNFSAYGALIIAAALSLGCTRLLTGDMQHGRVVGGMSIENPFLVGKG